MKRYLIWALSWLLVAAAAHLATIRLAPSALMRVAMNRLSTHAGINQIVHAPRADASQRSVVMPSPDFLYSYCVFDLSHGALHVTATVPAAAYWSMSAYDARTDNFYAIDDRSVRDQSLNLWLIAAEAPMPSSLAADIVVRSPSSRGVLLFRTLVDRDRREAELDRARRQASCQLQAVATS